MNLRTVLFASLLAVLPLMAQGATADVADARFAALDDIISSAIASKVFPGAVLIVGSPDKVYWSKAYGRHTYDSGAPEMKLDTIFDLASVTKVVGTATCAMGLIEDEKLGLDQRVTKYIPQFAAENKDSVTIRDLMTHVSGLPSYVSAKKAEEMRKPGDTSADAMIRTIASLKTTSAPRTRVIYSCLNMQTLARVNETALDGRMDDYLVKRVYGKLGMKDTCYVLSEEQKSRCAPSVKKPDGTLLAGDVHDPIANYHSPKDHCPGNAGLFSTAGDLARYCTMILNQGGSKNQRIFRPETIRLMTRVQTPKGITDIRALGWDVYTSESYCTDLNQTDATRVIGHTGYTGTSLWLDKLSKTYIVLLTNRTFPDDSRQSRKISNVRRQVSSTVLHALPKYKSYYAKQKPLVPDPDSPSDS